MSPETHNAPTNGRRPSAPLPGHNGGRRRRLPFPPTSTSTSTLVVCDLPVDLRHPALIRLARRPTAPPHALGHLLLDRLRALECQPVVHRRRRQQRQVDRLRLGRLFQPLVLHRVVPAVDQRRVAVDLAHPRRVRAVRALPVFPADLWGGGEGGYQKQTPSNAVFLNGKTGLAS